MKKTILFSLPLFLTMIISSCGQTGGSDIAHTHTFGDAFKHDDSNHWHECECGEKDGVTAHDWGEGTVTTPATCEDDGVRTYTCVCGATKTESITKLGHEASNEWQYDEVSHWHSCVHEGCYDELNKADHTFVEDESKRQDASCTQKGSKTMVCSVCNYQKVEDIPMAEHDWDEGKITTPTTCTTKGVKTYTCQDCGRTRTEDIDAPGHTWENGKSSGEAYQFNASGTWDECEVCHTKRNEEVTAKAPWAAFDFQNESNITIEHEDPTAYNLETHTLTSSNYNNNNGVKYLIADIVDTTRLVLDVTVTVDGETSYGAQASFFFFDELGNSLGAVFCLKNNPFQDAAKHNTQFRTTALENGESVNYISAQGVEFTYRFDFRGFEKAPRAFAFNGANGLVATPDIITIKSIVAKETVCGHSVGNVQVGTETSSTCKVNGYTEYVCCHDDCDSIEYRIEKKLADHTPVTETGGDKAYKYEWGGSRTVCSVCGEIIDESEAQRAPWARTSYDNITLIESAAGTNKGHTPIKSVDDNGVSMTGFYNAGLKAQIGSESQGRNILSITLKPSKTSWGTNFYMRAHKDRADSKQVLPVTQFYSGSLANWMSAGGMIYNATGDPVTSITYEGFYTFEIDLSASLEEGEKIESVVLWSGWDPEDSGNNYANAPTMTIKDITFKSSYCGCPETIPVEFNDCLNCGTKCQGCGEILTNYVGGVDLTYGNSVNQSLFTLEQNVTFDGKTCAKLTTGANFNSSEGGWTQNYKLRFNGIIGALKNNGMTKFSIDFYIKAASDRDVRFYWGAGNNNVYAYADNYNPITPMDGKTGISNNSTFTALGEKGLGDTGSTFLCNDWYRLTVDLSDESVISYGYFFISACLYVGGSASFPYEMYISQVSVSK